MSKAIELGNKVKDKVSGLTGIATSRVEYLNGCVQYCIKPPVDKDGKLIEGEYFDEEQVAFVGKGVSVKSKPTGSTQADVPSH